MKATVYDDNVAVINDPELLQANCDVNDKVRKRGSVLKWTLDSDSKTHSLK